MAVLVPGRLRVCEVDMHMMLQTADVSARRLQPQTLIDDACFVRGIAMPCSHVVLFCVGCGTCSRAKNRVKH